MDEEENELKRDKHLDVVAVVDDVDGGRIIFMFVTLCRIGCIQLMISFLYILG